MHSRLPAIVLCIATQAASAQCAAQAREASPPARPGAMQTMKAPPAQVAPGEQAVQVAQVAQVAPGAHPRGELIQTAAAGTREDAPARARDPQAGHGNSPDHPRRGGTAMLLAALALMSGIALRRYGSPE